ncbi:MAG: Ig-like domain-containing protein [Bacteroidales bacterium]|nr:Ig-like domain-containing protein [Bacteroidales bacterium]
MKKFLHFITGTIIAISALCGCEPKEELKLPEVGLPTVTEQVQGTLNFVSSLVANGNTIQEYGFYYGTTTPPTNHIPATVSGNEFSASVNISDIAPGTPIFVKSYIIISSGTISSDVVSYTTKTIPAEQVILSDDEVGLSVGSTYALTATVLPENTTDVLTWENSNPKIAELSQDGVIKAIQPGQTIITAKAGTKTAVCLVSVGPLPEAITLDQASLSLVKGESAQLTATVTPADATAPVVWASSDENIAVVSEGKVTAVNAGKAVITASVDDKSASCEVTVVIPSESITLDRTNLVLNKGLTAQLTATVTPADATDALEWSSSDEAVATVSSSGLVTAKAGGSAVITVKTGALSATCNVQVVVPTSSISLDPESATLYVGGESLSVKATVLPEDADNKEVVWESSDKAVVTVDAAGNVSPVSRGQASVMATVKGTNISATCKITVTYKEVESVDVTPATMNLYIGDKGTLTATVLPEYAVNNTVTWSSADETIATVSQTGEVTAIALGTVEISATAGQKTGKCKVSVLSRLVTSVTLDKSEISMILFEKDKLTATVTPSGALDGEITWSSSNNEVVTVDENGNIAAQQPGNAVIIAKAGNYSAQCNVTINSTFNAGPDNFEQEKWVSGYEYAELNVLPPSGNYGAIYAQFNTDLNLYFSTDNGWAIRFDKRLSGYKFFFSPEMEKVTDVGGIKVKFEIENEFVLKATVDGKTAKVAELFIDETSHYYRRDHLTFNKSSEIARRLLSTGQFFVYLDIYAMCGVHKVDIFFNGNDYFKMLLNPPLSATMTATTKSLYHGRKYGAEGTYFNLDGLFRLVDWREISFFTQPLLWDYYGEFTATIDTETAYWTLDGSPADAPDNVDIECLNPVEGKDSWGESNLGFVAYYAPGAYPGNYNYYCRFKIDYGFGTLLTDYIRIKIVED